MNYYIQGDAAKAEQIRAAFEELGYDVKNWRFTTGVYYTLNGRIVNTNIGSNEYKLILNNHDYKELELLVEPKFKVGDWVVFNNSHNSIYQISEIRDSYYMLTHTHGGSMSLSFSQGKLIRPWTIEDAKDGDVLVSGIDNPFIYDGNSEFSSAGAYVGVSRDGRIRLDMFPSRAWASIKNVKPATKEQCDLFFAKMKKAGYQWDADKKELKKIQPHYYISNFKPKQWVLVRDDDEWEWSLTRFSHLSNGSASLFVCINGASFQQCIPFEKNGHLLGTTDMCDECYVNW